jgi:hypothetical protein
MKAVIKNETITYCDKTATWIDVWVECPPRSKTKRVMLGGFRRECSFIYNGVQSEIYATQKAAKQAFIELINK